MLRMRRSVGSIRSGDVIISAISSKVILLLCGGVLSALFVFPSYSQPLDYDWKSWGAVTDTLRTEAPGRRLLLTAPFILAGSDTVHVDGIRLTSDQYEINYQRGMIRILTPVREGALVRASYTRLPFLLDSVYLLREVEFGSTAQRPPTLAPPVADRTDNLFNPTGDLVFGGVKSISLSFGSNKSTALDQTLRATVEGNLTSSIKVRALLSDNNLPIQPEGNTEELEYLDKVLVELSGPNGKATLVDFSFSNDYSNYTEFRRELKGVSGEVSGHDSKVGAAAGSSKGVFRSISFRGTEQLQGPYELLSPGRVNGEVIIAGTERVYFDGDELQRGQNRDYTIDYDVGTITFTPRRLVTADTEIAIDFEVTQEQYSRTSTFAIGETSRLPAQFKLQTLLAREHDDSDRPKALSIEDPDRLILADAGDDEELAIAVGITFVGAGNGDYDLVPGNPVAGIPDSYTFNDSMGEYHVLFVEVGAGNGDYVLDGISAKGVPFYQFEGVGQGNYVIGKKLPLPQSHSVMTTRLSRSGRFDADLQFNVSDFDRNTLSDKDDGDNIGDAGEVRLGFKELPVGIGKIDIRGSVSTIEDNFRSLEKTRRWYFYRDWNLEQDALVGREILQQLTSTFRRFESVRLDYDFGFIKRDNFDGVKNEGRVALAEAEDRSLTGRVFDTDIDGDNEKRKRTHGSVSTRYGLWKLLPSAHYTAEEYLVTSPVLADSGIAYNQFGVGLAAREVDRVGYAVSFEQRATEQRADSTGGWIDTRTDRTFRASLSARRIRSLQGELEYSHREQDDKFIGNTQTSDLARLKAQVRAERIGLRTNIDYEISQNQFRSQEKTVVFVGEGQGDYNELGEPVGKGRGSHTLVFLPTLETIPTRSVAFTVRLNWKPPSTDATSPLSWVRRNVSLDQQLTVREESTFDDAYRIYLMFPSALQRDDSTLRGVVSLRQEWFLLNGYPDLGLTFRYQRDDEEENSFGAVKENKFFQQQIVRVDRAISKLVSANLELTRELRRRHGQGLFAGTGSTYDVEGWAVAAGWGLRFSAGSSIDGHLEFRRRKDDESAADERSVSLKPRFVWRVTKAVNVFGRYELTRFSDGEPVLVRPFFFSAPGTTHRWSLTPNIKISKLISVLSTYEGRSEDTFSGDRITEHAFRIETRAFF
jgi:hypothetical protein